MITEYSLPRNHRRFVTRHSRTIFKDDTASRNDKTVIRSDSTLNPVNARLRSWWSWHSVEQKATLEFSAHQTHTKPLIAHTGLLGGAIA